MADNKTPKSDKRNNINKKMSIWDHLRDLRNCIVFIAVTYILAAIGCYCFAPEFITYAMSLAKDYTFVQTGVAELMTQYILVSLIAAAVLDSPIIIWQIAKFVGPGLNRSEEVKFLAVLICGLLLFIVGTLFGIFIVVPFTLQFFLGLNTIGIAGMYSIKEYISYIVSLLFSFGVIFEIPVVTAVLTSFGLLKPQWLRSGRRFILVLCFILGAIITPPDIASQTMVALPMYLLFELGVVVSRVVYKGRCKKLRAQGIDPEENTGKKQKKAGSARWAAAAAAVEKKDAEKKRRSE